MDALSHESNFESIPEKHDPAVLLEYHLVTPRQALVEQPPNLVVVGQRPRIQCTAGDDDVCFGSAGAKYVRVTDALWGTCSSALYPVRWTGV